MADAPKIVHIKYKLYLEDTGKMVDTNIEECAKENNIYDEKVTYGAYPYIMGSGRLYPAVEEAIASAEPGKEIEVIVPSENAEGARDPKLIELHPIKDFYRQNIDPFPGMPVSLGNRTGVILSVGAGRVKVDFNSPLAGHDLTYKVEVVDEVTDPVEKAKAVIDIYFNSAEDFGFEISGDKIVVTEADVCKFRETWPLAKYSIVNELRKIFGVDRIEFVEVWDTKKAE